MKISVVGLNLFVMASLLFGIAGCAVTDVDRKVDFNSYRTFSWGPSDVKAENPVYNSDLINKNIKATVENEFAKRGIVLDRTNPDFLVSYHTYTEKKERISGGYPYGAYPFYYPWRFYGWGMPYGMYNPPVTSSFTEGVLIVDIKDNKTKEVVWRGTVSGNVDNIKKLERQIQKGVKAIMKKYPVPAFEKLHLPNNDVIG
jgi:hypothetical protein